VKNVLEKLPACMIRKFQNPGEEYVSAIAGATVQKLYT